MRQYQLQLRPDEVLAQGDWATGSAPRIEDIQVALTQLSAWGNLEAQPDMARVSSLSDYYRVRSLYRLSAGGEAVEVALDIFAASLQRRAELQTVALEDIAMRLQALCRLAAEGRTEGAVLDAAKVHETLRDLAQRFEEMTRNAQHFMAGVAHQLDLRQADALRWVQHKRRLIDYLERFLGDLVRRSGTIAAHLRALEPDIESLLQAVAAREARDAAFDAAGEQLRQAVADRHEAIARLMQRHEALRQAQWQQQEHQRRRDDNQAETDDAAVEQQAQHLIEAWHDHLHGLQCLQLPPDEREAALVALADWVREPLALAPPRRGLQDAHLRTLQALSAQQVALDQTARTLAETRDRLDQERQRLEAGEEVTPLAPAWRDPASRVNRPGAPLWQLIEFDDPVPDGARAGLEAALEASGLLDAWVSPDGHLQHDPERDGTPW